MKNILRLLTGYKTPISRTPNFFAPLRLCAMIFLCAFAPLRDLKAQKAIHELPAKTTIDTNYLFIQGNPTTGKLYKTRGAALNAFISGGGGGSQTLDQVLTEGIVFTPTPSDLDYNFIKVNPIDTFSSQVPFRMTRWNVPQNSGAVAGNEGLMFGFNLNSGGGIIESGKPAIGFSIESNYLPDYATRYVEWHDLYIPSTTINGLTAGNQVRLSSYTINTATNNIDLYRRVGREYLMVPGTSVQYWLVQPGSFNLVTADGSQGVNHSVDANRYTITATGTDTTMSLAGFDFINFGNARLQDLVLPSYLPLYYDTLINPSIGFGWFRDMSDRTKYMAFDPDGSNGALTLYGGNGISKIWTYSVTELRMNFTGGNSLATDLNGLMFEGAGSKRIWGEDLTLKLGLSASYRFSEAWVRDGHFNQMAIQSKSSDPTTSDVSDGMWMVWKNTTTGNTYIYMNDGGTMKRINSAFVTF